MAKDPHQTVPNTSNGILSKFSGKTSRVQIPEFEKPIPGIPGKIPTEKIDLESTIESILNNAKDNADETLKIEGAAEFEASQADLDEYLSKVEPKPFQALPSEPPADLTVAGLYNMILELQKRGGMASDLEMVWSEAMSNGQTAIEIPEPAYFSLTKGSIDPETKKYVDPGSVIYKNVRIFKKGTMDAILDGEGVDVNYARGMSTRKFANQRFKGRT